MMCRITVEIERLFKTYSINTVVFYLLGFSKNNQMQPQFKYHCVENMITSYNNMNFMRK